MRVIPTAFACVFSLASLSEASAAPQRAYPRGADREYTDRIREHTTAPEFLSELVDHLPRSRRVPSPLEFLGYVAGAPDKLTYAADIHDYMRALAKASRNVEVFPIGKTAEGREQLVVVIANPATLRRLDRYKEMNRALSDPRKTDEDEAERLIRRAKPMYWLTGGLHSPETGAPEMLMELAYRLAVGNTPMIRNIRRNVITMITPVLEVDGRERMVDATRWWQQNKDIGMPPLVYWGHYVVHDNNRDSMSLSLNLTRNVLSTFLDYRPQVFHDLHESIPFLYISTGTGPYNAWLDPVAVDTWRQMAQHEVAALTRRGMPGVWNHGFYDGWAPSYIFYIGHGHNAIGRFYETYGNATPETRQRRLERWSTRQWFRPNPPYPVVEWSLRNNVNYQQSGVLVGLDNVASNSERFMEIFYTLGKRAVAKARTEGPAAYVLPGDQSRLGQARDLLGLLQAHGVEVHRTTLDASVVDDWPPKRKNDEDEDESDDEKKSEEKTPVEIPAGSWIVRMDQPYSRLADMLLDTQYYRPDDSRPYDDTGWTFGYAKNVTVHRIVSTKVLDVPMKLVEGVVSPEAPRPEAASGGSFAVVANADTDLYRYLWRTKGTFEVADEPMEVDGRELPSGTLLLPGTKANLDAADGLAVEIVALPTKRKVASHSAKLPRIAFVHTWYRTQDEGWYRLALEDMGVPYDYISTQDVAAIRDLKAKYDVVLFPPCGCRPNQIVWGLPAGKPIPWKKTKLTPNLGRIDSTDDMRPGLGLEGVASLRRFVRDGGTLVTFGDTARFAIQYGLTPEVSERRTRKLKARGSLIRAEVADPRSPIAYGYDDVLPVYFARGPLFQVGRYRKPDKPDERPTGRGGPRDPDVPQGRPFVAPPDDAELPPHERGYTPWDRDSSTRLRVYTPPVDQRPRVVVRYAKKQSDLLLSGMLEGGKEMAGTPAVVDAPLGKGHVILFGINPMWRQHTQGTFALVFNAVLNHGALSTGWPPPSEPAKKADES
jgi:hypothetical protein